MEPFSFQPFETAWGRIFWFSNLIFYYLVLVLAVHKPVDLLLHICCKKHLVILPAYTPNMEKYEPFLALANQLRKGASCDTYDDTLPKTNLFVCELLGYVSRAVRSPFSQLIQHETDSFTAPKRIKICEFPPLYFTIAYFPGHIIGSRVGFEAFFSHSGKLTWHWKKNHLKMNILLNGDVPLSC